MTRVAVLYNAPTLPTGHPDAASEADVVAVASVVLDALIGQGFDAHLLPASPPLASVLEALAGSDVVFNLIEGFAGSSIGEAYLTGLLELLGLPYTGCPPSSQALCHSKARTKALLRGFGLPTAPFAVARAGEPVPTWDGPWPAIVKPEAEDASLGIDQGSVVRGPVELAEALIRLRSLHGGDALIESYLPGREFNVGVLALPEPEALPVAEIAYDMPAGSWPILTYDAKWAVGSDADLASPAVCPADIEPKLAARLASLAVEGFRATGCRDYARVDFRLDAKADPMILEVNPNPDLGPGAGWARALRASGRDHAGTLAALARRAFERGARP